MIAITPSHLTSVRPGPLAGILVNPLFFVRPATVLRSMLSVLPGHLSEHTALAILGLSLVTLGSLVRLYYANQKKHPKIGASTCPPESPDARAVVTHP
jgi:hypothetical protein